MVYDKFESFKTCIGEFRTYKVVDIQKEGHMKIFLPKEHYGYVTVVVGQIGTENSVVFKNLKPQEFYEFSINGTQGISLQLAIYTDRKPEPIVVSEIDVMTSNLAF